MNGGSGTAGQATEEARKIPARLGLGPCQRRLDSRCQVTGVLGDARALGGEEGCVRNEGQFGGGFMALKSDSPVKHL